VRQYRIGAGQELYEIPAGVLEPGESYESTAIRELREEIGFQPTRLEALGAFYPAPGYTTEFIQLFLARDLEAAPLDPDEDEMLEILPVPLAEALAMIERGDIVDAKTIIGIMRAAARLSSA
jgi:ADP-ribose pyrophosphatase